MNAAPLSPVFAADRLGGALQAACSEAGLDARGAVLLRVTSNAVYRLASAPVVVRLSAPRSRYAQVCRTVEVARWLCEAGFPAVRLHGGHAQPVVVGEYLATFWDYLPPAAAQPPPEALAGLLRQLHPLTAPFPLPRWNPVCEAQPLLAAGQAALPATDRVFLQRWGARLEADLARLSSRLPSGVIHGDAWQGNLLTTRSGAPVLCDLDQVCVGPREWDLVPTVVNALRFGYPDGPVRRFLDAYGFDVTAWPGFPVLRSAREFVMLAGVVPVLASSPAIAAEFTRRLAGIRDGRDERWTPYP